MTISAMCRPTCGPRGLPMITTTSRAVRSNTRTVAGSVYVITVAGPEPLEIRSAPIDYDHYVTRQLQPVADAILPFVDDDFFNLDWWAVGPVLSPAATTSSHPGCRGNTGPALDESRC